MNKNSQVVEEALRIKRLYQNKAAKYEKAAKNYYGLNALDKLPKGLDKPLVKVPKVLAKDNKVQKAIKVAPRNKAKAKDHKAERELKKKLRELKKENDKIQKAIKKDNKVKVVKVAPKARTKAKVLAKDNKVKVVKVVPKSRNKVKGIKTEQPIPVQPVAETIEQVKQYIENPATLIRDVKEIVKSQDIVNGVVNYVTGSSKGGKEIKARPPADKKIPMPPASKAPIYQKLNVFDVFPEFKPQPSMMINKQVRYLRPPNTGRAKPPPAYDPSKDAPKGYVKAIDMLFPSKSDFDAAWLKAGK